MSPSVTGGWAGGDFISSSPGLARLGWMGGCVPAAPRPLALSSSGRGRCAPPNWPAPPLALGLGPCLRGHFPRRPHMPSRWWFGAMSGVAQCFLPRLVVLIVHTVRPYLAAVASLTTPCALAANTARRVRGRQTKRCLASFEPPFAALLATALAISFAAALATCLATCLAAALAAPSRDSSPLEFELQHRLCTLRL